MKGKIPNNLEECFESLDVILGDKVEEFKQWGEEEAISKCHHGFGTGLRNEWGLWNGSELKSYFKDMGLWHADDMSSVILVSYHRHLNKKSLDLDSQVQYYKDFWANKNNNQQGNNG